MTRLRIEVPATSANLGPGFDTLGLALDIVNTIYVQLTPDDDEVALSAMTGDLAETLDPHDNLLCAAYRRWGEEHGVTLPGARFTVYTPPTSCGSCLGSGVRCGVSVVARVRRSRFPLAIVARVGKIWISYSVTAPGVTGRDDALV